ESANVSVRDEHVIAEPRWAKAVRVHIDEYLAATLPAFSERADLHDLPGWADGDIPIGAVIGAWDCLSRKERTNLTEAGNRGTGGEHRPARIEDDPHLA